MKQHTFSLNYNIKGLQEAKKIGEYNVHYLFFIIIIILLPVTKCLISRQVPV